MTAYEIAFGVVLIIVSVLIVVFTLSQTQKGQGCLLPLWVIQLYGCRAASVAGCKLAKVTKICGAVFYVATAAGGGLSAR